MGYAHDNLVYDAFQWVYDPAGDISDAYSLVDTEGTPTSLRHLETTRSTPTTPRISWQDLQQLHGRSRGTDVPVRCQRQFWNGGPAQQGHRQRQSAPERRHYHYQYDADGNCIAATSLSDGTVTGYVWDNRNRLVEVDSYSSVADYNAGNAYAYQRVRYVYDYANRWLGETVTTVSGGVGTVVMQREFAYDGTQIVLQFDGTGAITERYLWGPAGDMLLAQESPQNPGEVDWALTDNLNTVVDIVATNGGTWTWAEHRILDAFDQTRATQYNEAVDMIFGAYGRPFDDTTGLQNDLNRWYDPSMRRWLSQDPLGRGPGLEPVSVLWELAAQLCRSDRSWIHRLAIHGYVESAPRTLRRQPTKPRGAMAEFAIPFSLEIF